MKRMMLVLMVVAGVSGLGSGCADAGGGAEPVAVTLGELSSVVAAGPARVEVRLEAGGAVSELVVSPEIGHDEQVEGALALLDASARQLGLEDLGAVVTWEAGARFRTPEDSRVSEAEWLAAVGAARAAGAKVWIRADRPRPAVAQDPSDPSFAATELRLERGTPRAKFEGVISQANLDEAASELALFGQRHDLSQARLFDDHGTGVEPGDDNGGANEAGDDNGGANEAGDDNGGANEAGDDNGGANEAGDDNGGANEAGDDNGGANEAGDDNGGANEAGEKTEERSEGEECRCGGSADD